MSFETLIRETIVKQRAETAAERTRIYDSARAAMERMIARDVRGDDAGVARQRAQLEGSIATIEAEFGAERSAPDVSTPVSEPLPSTASAPPSVSAPSVSVMPTAPVGAPVAQTPSPMAPAPSPVAPSTSQAAPGAPQAAPSVSLRPDNGRTVAARQREVHKADHARVQAEQQRAREEQARAALADNAVSAPPARRSLRKRRRGAGALKLALWLLVLSGIAAAAWWAATQGPAAIERNLGALTTPTTRSAPGDAAVDDGWIGLFEAANDAAAIDATGGGTVDLRSEDGETFVRLIGGGSGAGIRINVPEGVTQSIGGTRATFEFVARASAGGAQPFAIACEFRGGADCGRKRFEAKSGVNSFLFDADVPAGDGANAIVVDPDLDDEGRALDLFSVRVRRPE